MLYDFAEAVGWEKTLEEAILKMVTWEVESGTNVKLVQYYADMHGSSNPGTFHVESISMFMVQEEVLRVFESAHSRTSIANMRTSLNNV